MPSSTPLRCPLRPIVGSTTDDNSRCPRPPHPPSPPSASSSSPSRPPPTTSATSGSDFTSGSTSLSRALSLCSSDPPLPDQEAKKPQRPNCERPLLSSAPTTIHPSPTHGHPSTAPTLPSLDHQDPPVVRKQRGRIKEEEKKERAAGWLGRKRRREEEEEEEEKKKKKRWLPLLGEKEEEEEEEEEEEKRTCSMMWCRDFQKAALRL